jgi:hypothetical protein
MSDMAIFRQLTFTIGLRPSKAVPVKDCRTSTGHQFSQVLARTWNKTLPHKKAAPRGGLSLLSPTGSTFHCVTVKLVALMAVPLGVVMAIFPVTAPVGTLAVT